MLLTDLPGFVAAGPGPAAIVYIMAIPIKGPLDEWKLKHREKDNG